MTTFAPPVASRPRPRVRARTATTTLARHPEGRSSTPPKAPTISGYRRDVQGLRGLAVLLVVCFHAGLGVSGGFLGVDVFFVVSGFVITLGLLTELRSTGSVSLRGFYTRRARRLLPIFALVSVTTILGSLLVLRGEIAREAMARTARAASLLTANVQLESEGGGYFDSAAELNPFLHTWSLSVEEQFYLVLPALLLLTWKLGRSAASSERWVHRIVAVVTVASFAAAAVAVGSGDLRGAFYSMPLRAWEFGLGVLLALNLHRLSGLPRRAAALLGVVGLAAVLAAAMLYDASTTFPGPSALPATVGTALLIAAGATPTVVTRMLSWRPLTWVGDRSYGWYLWHWPAIVLAGVLWPDASWALPAAALVALGVTAMTYPLVEQSLRYARAVTGVAVVVLVGVLVNVPVATASIVARDAEVEIGEVDGEFATFTRAWGKCSQLPWPEQDCVFPVADQVGEILLLGDSHATVLSDVVTAAAAELDRGTVVSTMFGCPAIPRGVLDGGEQGGGSCTAYQDHALSLVEERDPDVIVLAHRSPYYLLSEVGPGKPILADDGIPASTQAEALQIWADGYQQFLDQVDRPVLVVSTVPTFPEELRTAIAAGRADDPSTTIPLVEVQRRRGDALAAETMAMAGRDVVVIDPLPLLCPTDPCSARDGQQWRYHDDHHLRAYTTSVFGEPLARGLLRLLKGVPTAGNL